MTKRGGVEMDWIRRLRNPVHGQVQGAGAAVEGRSWIGTSYMVVMLLVSS